MTAKSNSTATCVSCSEIGGVTFVIFLAAGVVTGVGFAVVGSGDLDVRGDLVPEVGYFDAGVRVSGEL